MLWVSARCTKSPAQRLHAHSTGATVSKASRRGGGILHFCLCVASPCIGRREPRTPGKATTRRSPSRTLLPTCAWKREHACSGDAATGQGHARKLANGVGVEELVVARRTGRPAPVRILFGERILFEPLHKERGGMRRRWGRSGKGQGVHECGMRKTRYVFCPLRSGIVDTCLREKGLMARRNRLVPRPCSRGPQR